MTFDGPLTAERPAFFDEHGRCVPRNLTAPAHHRVRRRFQCHQPQIDFTAIHARLSQHLDCPGALTGESFQRRAEAILANLANDSSCAAITHSVAVPFFLPMLPNAQSRDIGTDLEHIYIPAVGRSYEAAFPQYSFTQHDKSGLSRKVSVAAGSRHERLLERLETGGVVGYLFLSLTEYSLPAAIEQVSQLPEPFLLAGGHDLCAALIGSPELLLRKDGYPPLMWMAGLAGEGNAACYHFEAYGYNLTFNRRVHLGLAAEYWASALVVLG